MWNVMIFLLITALLGSAEASICTGDFVGFVDSTSGMESCFLFAMDKKREWYEARSFCRDQSADLAFLDDGDLHFQIIDYIVSHRDWRDEGFHIGGNDADVEGQWNWVMPQQPMDMGHHWWPGQPDGGRRENFACLYTPDFFFNSCVNGQRLYTLCRV